MNGRVTMINELPELQDLEPRGEYGTYSSYGQGQNMDQNMLATHLQNGSVHRGAGLPPGTENTFKKYVRNPHHIAPEAGMSGNNDMRFIGNPPNDSNSGPRVFQGPNGEMIVEEQIGIQPKKSSLQHHCLDIAHHVQDCPICSKFYNNDRTVYIIAIIVLSIISLLLLKRVLNV